MQYIAFLIIPLLLIDISMNNIYSYNIVEEITQLLGNLTPNTIGEGDINTEIVRNMYNNANETY